MVELFLGASASFADQLVLPLLIRHHCGDDRERLLCPFRLLGGNETGGISTCRTKVFARRAARSTPIKWIGL